MVERFPLFSSAIAMTTFRGLRAALAFLPALLCAATATSAASATELAGTVSAASLKLEGTGFHLD